MSNPSTEKTDRELLILVYERVKVMTNTLVEVKYEVKKTNGRVTVLELWKARLGGAWIVVIIGSGVLSAILTAFIEYMKH